MEARLLFPFLGSMSFPSYGKESIMPTLAHLTVDMSHVTEILEVAHKILRRNRDHDLVQKIMILQSYVELSRMNPERNYDHSIRKAFADLTMLVNNQLKGELA